MCVSVEGVVKKHISFCVFEQDEEKQKNNFHRWGIQKIKCHTTFQEFDQTLQVQNLETYISFFFFFFLYFVPADGQNFFLTEFRGHLPCW